MTMKAQPKGLHRKRRGEAAEDPRTGKPLPALEYDVFRGKVHLGYTKRADKGGWYAFPNGEGMAAGALPEPHATHGEAMEFIAKHAVEGELSTPPQPAPKHKAKAPKAEVAEPEPDSPAVERDVTVEEHATVVVIPDPEPELEVLIMESPSEVVVIEDATLPGEVTDAEALAETEAILADPETMAAIAEAQAEVPVLEPFSPAEAVGAVPVPGAEVMPDVFDDPFADMLPEDEAAVPGFPFA